MIRKLSGCSSRDPLCFLLLLFVFEFCALFPKDYIFDQDELIRLWIIQGLLQKGTAKTYQEVGMENLHRLEAASFLQKASDEKTSYSMHDLINDLAKSIDPCSYFSSDENKGGSTLHEDKVRHAAMVTKRYERCLSKRFDVFRSMKKLRTSMPFQISEFLNPNVSVTGDVIQDLIADMKSLRMLSLRYFMITQVPDRIGELKLLRSIDFSHTTIKILPESICDLVELQSLLLRECRCLLKLPRNIHKLVNLLHLDITGTINLQEMPPLIDELTNLEILSDFVVGKEVGQELKQLGPLGYLQRELHIRNLQYVHDVEDAKVANVFGKEAILKLSLDWRSGNEISREGDHQFNLIHHLQPPKKIESLVVNGYEAKRFPSWFNNQGCMQNVLSITLTGCRNVDSLPPLGQLPLLESLEMSDLEGISSIGPEFYGSKGPFFQSLKKLCFENMGAWEKWLYNGGDENGQPFPRLRQLIVKKCPKLKGGCDLSLPSLVEISIDGCGGGLFTCLAGLTSMTKMEIQEIPELVHFEGSLATSWVVLEEVKIVECPQFKFFVKGDGGKQVPPNLKVLEVRCCGELEKLADDLFGLTSLRTMSVVDCKKMCSFPSGGLPCSLRRLNLHGCPIMPLSQLTSIRLMDHLEELTLSNMEGLVSITELVGIGNPLSRSLRKLQIQGCASLTTLINSLQHMSALSALIFYDLPALEMEIFPSLPCNLSGFELDRCPKVKSLPHDMHHLASLKSLSIKDCQGITSLSLPCNLSRFELDRCPKVKSLPHDMHHLASLKSLSIKDCHGITSLSSSGGLPPNLNSILVGGCRNLNQPIEEWGLRGLTSLRVLSIWGEMECVDEMECFPPTTVDGDWSHLLPSSLLHLDIRDMKKLERVGEGLGHHLTSLQSLYIINCVRLRCLSDDGLPDSLESLAIDAGMEELGKKYRKREGKYWHSHLRLIPEVDFFV